MAALARVAGLSVNSKSDSQFQTKPHFCSGRFAAASWMLLILCMGKPVGTSGLGAAGSALALASDLTPPNSVDTDEILHSIPLHKQYVPVEKDGKIVAYKTIYFGDISVGAASVQNFSVVFDTGSGYLLLPSTECNSEVCMKHRRYNQTASTSSMNIEHDGTPVPKNASERDQIDIGFGTGKVTGEFGLDTVCLGELSPSCARLRIVMATEMTQNPFGLFDFDGVLGLGMDALTIDAKFSFFGQLVEQHPKMLPRFSVFLAQNDEDESIISFGGHDAERTQSELQWVPVAMKEMGHWQVKIEAIRIGDTTLDECTDGTCRAIFDSGTSLLGVPQLATRLMHRHLARAVPDELSEAGEVDCRRVPGQVIHFDMVGGVTTSLGVEDYSRPEPFEIDIPGKDIRKPFCRALLLPVNHPAPLGPKVFIFGEPMLRKYYTVYDLQNTQVGFALAKQPDQRAVEGAATFTTGAPSDGSLASGAPLASLIAKPE